MIVSPSILSADFLHLKEEIESIEKTDATWLHYDVMDGSFVPNISFGMDILKSVAKVTTLFLDVHLMIVHPQTYFDAFIDAGAKLVTFHYEAVEPAMIPLLIAQLHERGVKAGISIKPSTPVQAILPYLSELDLVLVMSVEPGFGGQHFMPSSLPKIAQLKAAIQKDHLNCLVEVDGGINDKTIDDVRRQGADVVVAGSYIFKAADRQSAVASLL